MLSYGLDAVSVAPMLVLVAVGNIVGTVGGGWLGDRFPKATVFVAAQVASGAVALHWPWCGVGKLPSQLGQVSAWGILLQAPRLGHT